MEEKKSMNSVFRSICYTVVLLSITFLVSCRNGKDPSDDDVKLTHESKYVKDKGDIVSSRLMLINTRLCWSLRSETTKVSS